MFPTQPLIFPQIICINFFHNGVQDEHHSSRCFGLSLSCFLLNTEEDSDIFILKNVDDQTGSVPINSHCVLGPYIGSLLLCSAEERNRLKWHEGEYF